MSNLFNKRIYCLIAFVIATMTTGYVSGRQLSVDEAFAIAKKESNIPLLRNSRNGSSDFKLVYTGKSASLSTIYVLNRENGGFIIMSADDVAAPVLGYSETGTIDTSDIPENMQSWLNTYTEEIAAAINAGISEYSDGDKTDYPVIAPLLKTTWNQSSPYNLFCPKQDGVTCPSGCTATAVAQVMKHHSWPEVGVGEYSYNWNNTILSFNYGNTRFEWDKMLNSYNGTESTEEKNAVATLMYAVGVGADMAYAKNASGALARNAARALIQNFNYDKAINYLSRQFYPIDKWTDMVYNELAEGRPVEYDGFNEGAGHSFVVDGYNSNGFFHLNWGWGGMSDGYFLLTALDPSNQGIGGSAAGYNKNQGALFGVQKPKSDSEYSAEFYILGNFKTDKTTYPRTDSGQYINFLDGTVNGMFYIASIVPFDIKLGLKLVSEKGETTYIWGIISSQLKPGHGYTNLQINERILPKSGTYTITPVVYANDQYYDVKVALGKTDKLKMTATESQLSFTADNEEPALSVSGLEAKNTFYTGKTCIIAATITNSGSEYYGTVKPVVSADNVVWAQMSEITIDLVKDESVNVEWSEQFKPNALPAGSYQLYLVDQSGKRIGDAIDITVKTPPTEQPKLEITGVSFPDKTGEITSGMYPAAIISRDIKIDVTIKCTRGLSESNVYAFVFPQSGGNNIDIAGNNKVILEPEESKSYIFSNTLNNVAPGNLYFIQFQGDKLGNSSFTTLYESSGNCNFWIYINPDAGIEVIETGKGCRVTPNPAETTATIESNSPIHGITIYNMSGNQIATYKFDGTRNSEQIDASAFMSGNYIVRTDTSSGTKIARLIKQ